MFHAVMYLVSIRSRRTLAEGTIIASKYPLIAVDGNFSTQKS